MIYRFQGNKTIYRYINNKSNESLIIVLSTISTIQEACFFKEKHIYRYFFRTSHWAVEASWR